MKKVLIMSGEASGDLHGANLARAITVLEPSISLYGVGSRHMREAGVRMLADASEISVVGIIEVITHIGVIYRVYAKLKRFLRTERPDLLVLIDFPDFNIKLGKAANRLGIPVLYYISPQVWVWRSNRIKTIARIVKAMVVVFPFEVPLYEKAGVPVRFFGHPLADVVRPTITREQAYEAFGLDDRKRTLALLPGSRKTELANLLPDMLKAARLLSDRMPDLQFILPIAPTLDKHHVQDYIKKGQVPVTVVEGRVYDVLLAADAALVTSGTATLEIGLMNVPMVIVYRTSPVTYWLLSKLVHGVRHVGLVNIIADRRLVPELIQDKCTPQNMAETIVDIMNNPMRNREIREGLRDVAQRLGESGASRRVAQLVTDMVMQVEA